jgi:N-acetyl-alpha-D-glucosaminyl L-malate synthase BshA
MTMGTERALKIGITCYPSVGGSGILASALGEELARRGHEAHFISYERPFRLPQGAPRIFYHPVVISSYGLFKYPDYTLPLSVKMAEVSRDCGLDVLHVHYAVPHATAAILAQSMLPPQTRPRVVTTLHGTDTTLLGRDAGYAPAIAHALERSDAVTTVSAFLEQETRQLMDIRRPIEVIHNFFEPHEPRRSREQIRRDLGIGDEALILHSSNLRPFKRIDLLLECAARIRPRSSFKLLILAGADFSPFVGDVGRLELEDRVIVRENVSEVEDYLQAADIGLFTSDMESFCLSILEAMSFGCPSVAARVGGIPEVVVSGGSGLLVPPGNADNFARAVERLIADPALRASLGAEARRRANELFSADAIVTKYERLYRRVCALPRG